MGQVYWLIDRLACERYLKPLLAAIESQGDRPVLITPPEPPYTWDDTGRAYRQRIPRNSAVVSLGDVGLISRILEDRDWTPGAFANIPASFCSSYLPALGDYWLNRDYIMLPFGDLARCRDFLFKSLGREGKIFVRPDSPLKLFTGDLISEATFDQDVEYLGFHDFPRNSLVVISSPKQLCREWRFVVVDGKVVAGSQYREGKELVTLPSYEPQALQKAEEVVATGFAPDLVWIVDICQTTDDKYHLLELGCFSFANLYGCCLESVVSTVSAAVRRLVR